MAGFYVGLFLLALFLVGIMIYMVINNRRPGQGDASGSSDAHQSDTDRQADLYERPHDHTQHKHHDQH